MIAIKSLRISCTNPPTYTRGTLQSLPIEQLAFIHSLPLVLTLIVTGFGSALFSHTAEIVSCYCLRSLNFKIYRLFVKATLSTNCYWSMI